MSGRVGFLWLLMASCGFMDHLNRVTIGEDESKI